LGALALADSEAAFMYARCQAKHRAAVDAYKRGAWQMIDPALLDYCTDRQREILEAIVSEGGFAAAARVIGCDRTYPDKVHRDVKKKAARQGYAPGHFQAGTAPGYHMGKVTIQRANGAVERVWERQHPIEEQYYSKIAEAIEALRVSPVRLKIPEPPANLDGDIIPWLQIGDAHIGMLACEEETGANFNISIGEKELCVAAAHLIDRAPCSKRFVVSDLGDGTHYENFKAMTEASGHSVDFDTRYWKMIDAYIRITLFIIDHALSRHESVDYIVSQGNHSRTNDIWIAALVKVAYRNTNRVNVLSNRSGIIAYRMGKTFVMIHHGDKMKPETLRQVMAEDYAVDWGETTFRYIDGGHVHHSQRKELTGAIFESWNNLAPRDKYANDGGWRSKQAMSVVLRSRTYGELDRFKLPIEKVRDMILATGEKHYAPPVIRAFAA
jgi:hypothetical protein